MFEINYECKHWSSFTAWDGAILFIVFHCGSQATVYYIAAWMLPSLILHALTSSDHVDVRPPQMYYKYSSNAWFISVIDRCINRRPKVAYKIVRNEPIWNETKVKTDFKQFGEFFFALGVGDWGMILKQERQQLSSGDNCSTYNAKLGGIFMAVLSPAMH